MTGLERGYMGVVVRLKAGSRVEAVWMLILG